MVGVRVRVRVRVRIRIRISFRVRFSETLRDRSDLTVKDWR